jgi:hypothetical protein
MKQRPYLLALLVAAATLAATGCDKRGNAPVNPESPTAPSVPTPDTSAASAPAAGASR